MLVRDYMTPDPTTLNSDACLLDAALMIRHSGKRHVPIVTRDGKAVGIISDRDVSRLSPSMLGQVSQEEYNRIFESTPIATVMTKSPITIAPNAPIADAVSVLYRKKIGALLVVENEKLVGILTLSDMLVLLNNLLGRKSSANASGQ